MSLGLSSSKQKQTTNQTSQSDPWDVATPYIEDFLGKDVKPLIGTTGAGPTAAQTGAYDELRANAQAGNPYAGDIGNLTTDLFGTKSRAPMVDSAYQDLTRRLSPVADGQNMNLDQDPYLQSMLAKVSEDARVATNETFAGAGRSFSGAHAGNLGKNISEAQLPALMQAYQYQTGRTDQAARDLNTGAQTTATTGANLDQLSQTLRSMGIDTGNAALEAQNYGPNQILAIEQQLKDLPVEQAAKLAAILFPAGQLGTQEQGTSLTKGSSTGFSAKVSPFVAGFGG
jgi:hypothetical protein